MKAVASMLGMAHSNVTHHFGSAAGLQAALAEQMIRDLVDAVAQVVGRLRAGEADRAVVIDMVFDTFDEEGAGQLIAWLASSEQQERLAPLCAAVADLVTALHGEDAMAVDRDAALSRAIVMIMLPALGAALIGTPLHRALGIDPMSYRSLLADQLAALKH